MTVHDVTVSMNTRGHQQFTSSAFFIFRSCLFVLVHGEGDLVGKSQTSVSGSVCLCVPGFWHLRTHTICMFCVWVRSTCVQFSRNLIVAIVRNFHSFLTLFSKDERQAPAPHGSATMEAEGRAGKGIQKKILLFHVPEKPVWAICWIRMCCLLNPLIQPRRGGYDWGVEDNACTEPSQPASPKSCFDDMARSTTGLEVRKSLMADSVSGSCQAIIVPRPWAFHFFLNSTRVKSWRKPYPVCIYPFKHSNYANVEGLHEWGCLMLKRRLQAISHRVNDPLWSLRPWGLNHYKPCRVYAVAGQVAGILDGSAERFGSGQGLSPKAVVELCCTTYLDLPATN